jgi:hypothetical protein
MKCNETLSKWCKNKHGASKIIDTFETYHPAPPMLSPPRCAVSRRHRASPMRLDQTPPCARPPPVDSPSWSTSISLRHRRVGAPVPADARPPGGCGESELDLLATGMERRRIQEAATHLAGGGGDFCRRQRLRRPRRDLIAFSTLVQGPECLLYF